MLRKLLKGVGFAVLACVLAFVIYLGYMKVTDYRPPELVRLEVGNDRSSVVKAGQPITVTTFNIGYCGLDASEDFFMDGGTMSRCRSLEQTVENLSKIQTFLAQKRSDIYLLQEVDVKADRSYNVQEQGTISGNAKEYGNIFATNYKVAWVPVPLTHPMGAVNGGILTLSKYHVGFAVRHQFPGGEAWPRQLAELDRCYTESRMEVDNGKELVVINAHFSAYDKGGKVRKVQLAYIKKQMIEEYEKGNYVIVGGDWNHALPGTDPKLFKWKGEMPDWCVYLPEDFTPQGFKWAVDKTVPSVRNNDKPFRYDDNFVAVIDGLVVSPNVEVVSAEGSNLGFRNSDHNPVTGTFIMK